MNPLSEHLQRINHLLGTSVLDWESPRPHTYEQRLGKLSILVGRNEGTMMYEWVIRHDRSGNLRSGSSESLQLAGMEALKYAEHDIRKAIHTGLLSI